jgi:hypothetical protein
MLFGLVCQNVFEIDWDDIMSVFVFSFLKDELLFSQDWVIGI